MENKADHGADGHAAGVVTKAMCAKGISRPAWHLKHRSATPTGAFSPAGENARLRVQAAAEPGEMRI
jgi:hypothetical protein